MNRYFSLLLTLCVCLFIGCGSIDENQPAQLISTVPAEGDTIDIKLKLCYNSATALVNNNVDTNPNPRSCKMAKKRANQVVEIPSTTEVREALQAPVDPDDIEMYNDPQFIEDMETSEKEIRDGTTKPWKEFKWEV